MTTNKKKNILISLDEEVYWKIKKYMNEFRIKSWAELFTKYLLPKMEEDYNRLNIKESENLKNVANIEDIDQQTNIEYNENIRQGVIEAIKVLKYLESRGYNTVSYYVLDNLLKEQKIDALNEDEYNLFIKEFPEAKKYFIKERDYYRLKQPE